MTALGPFRGDDIKKVPPAARALADAATPYTTKVLIVAVPGGGPASVHLLMGLEPTFQPPPGMPKMVPVRIMLHPNSARAAAEGILACLDSPEFKALAE